MRRGKGPRRLTGRGVLYVCLRERVHQEKISVTGAWDCDYQDTSFCACRWYCEYCKHTHTHTHTHCTHTHTHTHTHSLSLSLSLSRSLSLSLVLSLSLSHTHTLTHTLSISCALPPQAPHLRTRAAVKTRHRNREGGDWSFFCPVICLFDLERRFHYG